MPSPTAKHWKLAVALLPAFSGLAAADEDGAAFWISGQFASMSAVPPAPGWSLVALGNGYRGRMDPLRLSSSLDAEEEADQAMLLLQPGYAFDTRILGGTPYVSIAGGYGVTTTTLDIASPTGNIGRSQTLTGGADLNPFASLSWNHGVHNAMTYLSLNLPVGSYDADRIANMGLGHAALDWGAAYTFLDSGTGWEFSALAGLTYNRENPYTKYQNGIDAHLDWGASRWVSKSWELGVAGYAYYQLTGDSGSGDEVGKNRSRVAAIGPQIGYQHDGKTGDLFVSLRGYQEFWGRNRNEGQSLFLETEYSWNAK